MSAEALLVILVIALIVVYMLVQFILAYRKGTLHIDLDDTWPLGGEGLDAAASSSQ